jgi:triacylglycerol lipase
MQAITAVQTPDMDPMTAVKYGLLVQAAYEMFDLNPGNLNPPPGPNFPKNYALLATIQMTDFFRSTKDTEFYGFLACSTEGPVELVVALRGTRTYTEWWDDAHAKLVKCDLCPNAGCVADGFLSIYKSMQSTPANAGGAQSLREALSNVGAQYGIENVTVTGHSLGAALITLLALDANCNGFFAPTIYTLASPRVGDGDFVRAFNSRVANSYRVWNYWDEVPAWPKNVPWGDQYTHVKGSYEIDSWSKVHFSPGCNHALNSYLFMLSNGKIPLAGGCKPWANETVGGRPVRGQTVVAPLPSQGV